MALEGVGIEHRRPPEGFITFHAQKRPFFSLLTSRWLRTIRLLQNASGWEDRHHENFADSLVSHLFHVPKVTSLYRR